MIKFCVDKMLVILVMHLSIRNGNLHNGVVGTGTSEYFGCSKIW